MLEEFDLNSNFEGMGEFIISKFPKTKLSGYLKYSREKGVNLELIFSSLDIRDYLEKENETIIWGTMPQFGEITLINSFVRDGYYRGAGDCNKLDLAVSYILVGKHINKTDKAFYGVSISFTGLNEFCCRQTSRQIFDKTPFASVRNKKYTLEIVDRLEKGSDLRNILYSRNAKLNDLRDKVSKIIKKKGIEYLTISEPNCFINYKTRAKNSMAHYFRMKKCIETLFTALMFFPVTSNKIFFHDKDKNYPVIISWEKEGKKKDLSNHWMPIELYNIKDSLEEVFHKWVDLRKQDFNLLDKLIVERIYDKSVNYEYYVMLVAGMAQWQRKFGKRKEKTKIYNNFILENIENEDDDLFKKFKLYFADATIETLGASIGELRDCIIHTEHIDDKTDKYKKYQHILDKEMVLWNVCEVMVILFMRVLYKYLDIELNNPARSKLKMQLRTFYPMPF